LKASRSKILVIAGFLLFCTFMPLVNASRTVSAFYVKIYANPWDSTILKVQNGSKTYLMEFIQWGNVTEEGGNVWTPRIGRITWHVLMFGDLETMLGWAQMRFVMEFDSGAYAGKVVEGIGNGDVVLFPTGGGQPIGGEFVGHGDMHVKGSIGPIEVASGCKFVGYSW